MFCSKPDPHKTRRHSGDPKQLSSNNHRTSSSSQQHQQQQSRNSGLGTRISRGGSNFGHSNSRNSRGGGGGYSNNYYPRNSGGSGRGRNLSGEEYFFHLDGAPSYGESDPSSVTPVLPGLTYFYSPGFVPQPMSDEMLRTYVKAQMWVWIFNSFESLRFEQRWHFYEIVLLFHW